MLPNLFPAEGEPLAYNTVDAGAVVLSKRGGPIWKRAPIPKL
jgi:hypothetical protein